LSLDDLDRETLSKLEAEILRRSGGIDVLRHALPKLIADAIEFVVDPIRTGRTSIQDVDNVEKTFIGLKVEHFFRDFLDLPKGLRDLEIDGVDVDIKNTVRATWMIPPETYRNSEPCILIMSSASNGTCSLGLLIARLEYLSGKPNRDGKLSVSKLGRSKVKWLVKNELLPPSHWLGVDMLRFRQLREISGGTLRAATYFCENLGRVTHRRVLQALLFDQKDYMKRLRGNGGARDLLSKEGILLLSGAYDWPKAAELGVFDLPKDCFVSLRL
jgi:Restriction endonuclease NaeI